MSQENVEIARRAMDAWNRDDLDAFLAELDPDLEWHTAIEGTVEGEDTVFRGHDGARQVWENYRGEVFGRLEAWTDELRDLGDSVLRLGRLRIIGRTSGVELESEFAMILVIRDGAIVASRDYLSRGPRSRRAAGVGDVAGERQAHATRI